VRELTQYESDFLDLLRGGTIEQTQNRLKSQYGGMCCLGIACEGFRRRVPETAEWTDSNQFKLLDEQGTWFDMYLPPVVAEFYGLAQADPVMFVLDESQAYGRQLWRVVRATDLNDHLRWDFLRIADAFEYLFRNGKPQTTWDGEFPDNKVGDILTQESNVRGVAPGWEPEDDLCGSANGDIEG
jgi:hypothetical protein